MRTRTLPGLVAAALALTATLTACGGEDAEDGPDSGPAYAPEQSAAWKETVAAAEEEGKVVWYTVAPQASIDGLLAAFEKEFPDIEVEARKMGPAEMDAALEAERTSQTAGADVVTSVSYATAYDRQADGWYVDLEGPSVESGWSGTEYISDGQILSAPLGLVVVGWNTQLFPEGIDSYEDLYNPDLGDGAIGVVRPDFPVFADWWSFVEEHHDPDFVTEIAAQDPALFPNAVTTQEALVAGEIAIGTFTTATDMETLKEQGAPVDYWVPDAAWTAQNLFFIPESAEHSNAAQVFVDFFASPTGQLAAARNGYSPVPEVTAQTRGGSSEIVLTDVERMRDPGWYPGWLPAWKKAFGE
ncbi:extracellular solute-binding protein [Nocardioides carbamazepini]|uniref:ABC transporter substrate-binding protein n=1 Tax=Nocardioides carbamazepini TaxID=2854259 RepID=UPI002149D94E|nr:extracellular solute-binding protein [Nocardioides carbamazepini]MCR1785048.1 extracellular solute-binding protein [Nocardioides carbamazepini]